MKKAAFLLGLAGLLLASCATVQQNIDARAYLAKCRYEFEGLKVTGVTFSTGTIIDTVDFIVMLKITDTTDRDVALDHAQLAFYLDANHVLDAAHNRFVRIAAGASSTEPVAVGIPFAGVLKSLGHRPEKLGIKAKLWVTLLIGKATWETPIVIPVSVEIPIPWDQIDAYVAQREKQLEAEAAAKAAAAAKKVLPPVQTPSLAVPPVKVPSVPSAPKLP